MNKKQYKNGDNARLAISNVSEKVKDVIGKTLGPAGRNYYLPSGITNDGRTIMEQLRFNDENEDQVAIAYHEIARQQDMDGGDNTSTAMFMGATLYLDNVEKVGDMDVPVPGSMTAMKLLKKLDEEKDRATQSLLTKKVKVESQEALENVAMTAMENEHGAKIISETIFKAGKDTYPVVEYGNTGKITTETINGLEFKLKFDNATTSKNIIDRAEYKSTSVLVANHIFEDKNEIAPFFTTFFKKDIPKTSLVIVGRQFSIAFTNYITQFSRKTNFPIILLSGEKFTNDEFGDIASFCDAILFDTHPRTGNKITDMTLEDVGIVDKLVARDKTTQFIGGAGLNMKGIDGDKVVTRVQERVVEIKEVKQKEKDKTAVVKMDKRISALLGGITTVYVDAKTIVDKYYLKLKAEDAINSCISAMEDGMVQGGGKTFNDIAEELGEDSLLYKTLKAPKERIQQNNGGEEFDVENVFDSHNSMKATIENSVSVVKILLSVEGIISDKEESMVEELKRVHTDE